MRAKSVNFPQENKKTHPEDELRDRICNEQIRYGLLITASIKGCKIRKFPPANTGKMVGMLMRGVIRLNNEEILLLNGLSIDILNSLSYEVSAT